MSDIGRALRRLRRLRGLKQSHAAELLGVSQATVSRWERGGQTPGAAGGRALAQLISALSRSGDAALKRLVETSALPVHLVGDGDHRFLAASPSRLAAWRTPAGELAGRSLWRFASDDIRAAEARLSGLGWGEGGAEAVAFRTAARSDPEVPITPGVVLWERLWLDDGSAARLVSTLDAAPPHAQALADA